MRRRTVRSYRYIVPALLCLILAACNNDGPREAGLSLIQTTNPAPVVINNQEQKMVQKIKEDVEKFDEIYDVAVIKGKEDILVAYKVRHMKRFWMKDIEKKISNMLKKNFPGEKFTISSDYKIFLEAVELKENLKNPNYSRTKAEKKLKEIIKLKNEMT